MKKIMSLVLCLSLLLTSIPCFWVSAATKNFANAENWKVYGNSSDALNDEVGTLVSWGYVKQNTNSAYANGDSDSLKVNAKSQKAALPLTVEKNKDYVLSYKFFTDAALPTSGYFISQTGVIAPNHNTSPWNAEKNFYNFISYNLAFTSADGLFSAKVNDNRRTTAWNTSNTWHTVTLTFNSKDNETVMLAITPTVDSFYVDDVTLKEVSTFEELSNWGIYNTSSSDTNYQVATNYDGESCQTKMSWCNITKDTTVDADGTGSSIKINGNTLNVAANFPTLKANTEYTFSFKYKPSSTSVVASSTSAYFESHIIKKGTAFNQWNSGPATYVANLGKGTATTDWKEITATFTTDDTTDYMLEFRFGFSAGYVCYLDDFTLTEIVPPAVHSQVNDWKIYATGTTYVNENNGTTAGSWATVTTNNDENYIKDGDDCSLKISTINQFATYKFPVEKNAKYTVSYNFISETTAANGCIITRTGVLAEDSSVVWAAEKGYYNLLANNTAYTAKDGVFADRVAYSQRTTNYSATNTWHHIDLEFESGNNEYMYLTIFSAVNDVYVDEITVKKHFDLTVTSTNVATIEAVNGSANDYVIAGEEYFFKVISEPGTTPVVSVSDTVLTPDASGVYSFIPTGVSEIKIDCGVADKGKPLSGKDMNGNDLTKYNRDIYLKSFVEGDTVYHESVMFYKGRNTAKLLYPIDDIISLRSYDLKTAYIKGVDFDITEDGQLKILDGSRIKAYSTTLTKNYEDATADEKYYYIENNVSTIELLSDKTHAQYALAVTYTHTETWSEGEGFRPYSFAPQGNKLPITLEKLENGETVNILVFGASTSCGWSSSGLKNENYNQSGEVESNVLNIAPYAETWMDMLVGKLREKYPHATINMKNIALEGKTSDWGKDEIANRMSWLGDYQVDLLITSFGANDLVGGRITAEQYKSNMQEIINIVRSEDTANGNPGAEVLLWSYPLSNVNVERYNESRFLEFEEKLVELDSENRGVATVTITSAFREVNKSKLPADYLSNNCNHVDDFGVRIMAQGLLSAFEKPVFTPGDIDGNDSVNLKDLVNLACYVAKWDNLNVQLLALDTNGDGIVDLNDVTHLARYLAGWDVEL